MEPHLNESVAAPSAHIAMCISGISSMEASRGLYTGVCVQVSRLCCLAVQGLMQEVETPGRKDDGKEFALAMAQIAGDVKGQDLCLLHVAPLCTWTSWMLLVSVTSRPQLQAVLARVTREAKDVWDRCPRSNSPGQ